MKKYCLALDLVDDPDLIKEYTAWHERVWPEVLDNIRLSGVLNMEIYRYKTRLFMIMETEDLFSFERKEILDMSSSRVQEWERIMWKYQKEMPGAKQGEKWVLMEKIFSLTEIEEEH
ncbi:L-rhamnose mutarotase [Pseudopedobacter beijingensis]|uniref:L-rhamnose mutarotase n=1 Tax=Pseudopedobacter beijingensis TaxID=1207056 RepID=A0ABW4IDK1_9SPHI